jgi:formimidoylglutamate deiminase
MNALLAPHALLPGGWAAEVLLEWDDAGALTAVTPGTHGTPHAPRAAGLVVPGMPNLHSHAFQRAFAGLAEQRADRSDSFWSWRDTMYRFANAVGPEELEDIATHLYVQMLQAGYTAVCEFHYLHHDPQGRPYADRAEMARRIAAAASRAGIGLTLLPVLYQASHFGGRAPLPAQRRFVDTVDGLLDIAQRMRAGGVRVGVAPHSLRAVPPDALHALVAATHAADADAPVHIHIAEQQREVEDGLAWSGKRPVQWLLEHAGVDRRWCLVHATHADAAELRAVAASGATVGLCPTTEANLGDGRFDAPLYVDAGGAWGIGSDSHASVDVAEELRWLEYVQRLATGRRHVLAADTRTLWLAAVAGGARASGRALAGLQAGQQADFLVLRGDTGLAPEQRLAHLVYARPGDTTIDEVWVGGRRRIAQGRHPLDEAASRRYAAVRARLLQET